MIKLQKPLTAQEVENVVAKLANKLGLDYDIDVSTKKRDGKLSSELVQAHLKHKEGEKPKDHWSSVPLDEPLALISGLYFGRTRPKEIGTGDFYTDPNTNITEGYNREQAAYASLEIHLFACGCRQPGDIQRTLQKMLKETKV